MSISERCICAAVRGEQILVSEASARLFSHLPQASLRDLGEHTLKDIDHPVRLHQVLAPGLTADFPVPRTAGTHPTNLPPRLPSLLGRQEDLATLKELLASPETSVVTVVGPGGMGRTSLAAALGHLNW